MATKCYLLLTAYTYFDRISNPFPLYSVANNIRAGLLTASPFIPTGILGTHTHARFWIPIGSNRFVAPAFGVDKNEKFLGTNIIYSIYWGHGVRYVTLLHSFSIATAHAYSGRYYNFRLKIVFCYNKKIVTVRNFL
jgi:hypothetical protein